MLCVAKGVQGEELFQMFNPLGPALPFSIEKPRLLDTKLTPVDSARAMLKILVQQKALPALASGEEGRGSLKALLITMQMLGRTFTEATERGAEFHAVFPECFGEIDEFRMFTAQLLGEEKPTLAGLDAIMAANGESALVLVKQAVRAHPHWRTVESDLRRNILAEETLLPQLWQVHKQILDNTADWIAKGSRARRLSTRETQTAKLQERPLTDDYLSLTRRLHKTHIHISALVLPASLVESRRFAVLKLDRASLVVCP